MDDVTHLANYGQLGREGGRGEGEDSTRNIVCYAISIKNMSQIRKKYKNKVISSHRLVNICAGNRSGLIRDRNQIEIRDFFMSFL